MSDGQYRSDAGRRFGPSFAATRVSGRTPPTADQLALYQMRMEGDGRVERRAEFFKMANGDLTLAREIGDWIDDRAQIHGRTTALTAMRLAVPKGPSDCGLWSRVERILAFLDGTEDA